MLPELASLSVEMYAGQFMRDASVSVPSARKNNGISLERVSEGSVA